MANGWIFGALLLALREVAEEVARACSGSSRFLAMLWQKSHRVTEDLCAQNCALEAKMVVSKHLRQHCTLQAAILGQHIFLTWIAIGPFESI